MSTATKSSKTVPMNLCEPGQVLAKDVHNKKGQKVVSGDTELTEELIKRLVGAGVRRVDVYGTPDEPAEESESETSTDTVSSGPDVIKEDDGVVIQDDLQDNFVGDDDVTLRGNLENGAVLSSRGDIDVLGEIRDGTIRAMSGEIDVEGNIQSRGETVELISSNPIQVTSVENTKLSVQGTLVVRDRILDSRVECRGNLIVHADEAEARIDGSELEVEGKVLADRVVDEEAGDNEFAIRDPEVVSLTRKRKKKRDSLDSLKKEAEKLKNTVDTVRQIADEVTDLPPEKKQKLKKRVEEYKSVKSNISEANERLEEINDNLQELREQRRYFMHIPDRLQAGTSIEFENDTLEVSDDEHNVRIYKKAMIVIQDASDVDVDLSEWL